MIPLINRLAFDITIPLKTVSELNCSHHWTVKSKRHSRQKKIVKSYIHTSKPNITLPCRVRLTRIAPRMLDGHDNLPCSLKYIADAISEYISPGLAIGRADNVTGLSFIYSQERGEPKQYAVRVEIYCL